MMFHGQATAIRLLDFRSAPMRAFHMSWFAFFLCFFAWFGIAPLMHVVREEMHLTKDQVGWCIIGSVSATIFVRLLAGWLCDRIGPRLTYTWLLLLGSLPVMGIGLARDYQTFLLFRVAIGAIGASFVITQYHTSIMFAPNCVGTANATSAGWGNLGGGVTQMAMPVLFGFFVTTLGMTSSQGWRTCMLAAGIVCAITGAAYYFLVQDAPEGNFAALRRKGRAPQSKSAQGAFAEACRDYRVWILSVTYACCFGMELTLDNIAALYLADHFQELRQEDGGVALGTAGLIAGLFGGMNIFARALGGVIGDRFGARRGLRGRMHWLFFTVLCEGVALILFSQARLLALAVPALLLLGLFVKMANGATYSVVPFINRRALGAVSGIVGAGGSAGAVAAGFLFKSPALTWPAALLILGVFVTCASFLTLAVTFSDIAEKEAGELVGVGTAAPQPAPSSRELASTGDC